MDVPAKAFDEQHPQARLILKYISVRGFKAFQADDIGPLAPFTCIIGGNGLGKSVISDAITFVLYGLKGALLAEAANAQLLHRRGNAGMAVSLRFSWQGCNHGLPEQFIISRTIVCNKRTNIAVRHNHGKETKLSEVELSQRLEAMGLHPHNTERFLVGQGRLPVAVEDDMYLCSFLEGALGTAKLSTEIETASKQLSSLQAQLDDYSEELSRLAAERQGLRHHVVTWQEYEEDVIKLKRLRLLQAKEHSQVVQQAAEANEKAVIQSDRTLQLAKKDNENATTRLREIRSQVNVAETAYRKVQQQLRKAAQKALNAGEERERAHVQAAARSAAAKAATRHLRLLQQSITTASERLETYRLAAAELKTKLVDLDVTKRELMQQTIELQRGPAPAYFNELKAEAQTCQTNLVDWQAQEAKRQEAAAAAQDEAQRLQHAVVAAKRAHSSSSAKLAKQQADLKELGAELTQHQAQAGGSLAGQQEASQRLSDIKAEAEELRASIANLSAEHRSTIDSAIAALQRDRTGVIGRLCDIAEVSLTPAAGAVNAVLTHIFNLSNTIVVADRQAAKLVVQTFTDQRVGIAHCRIVNELKARGQIGEIPAGTRPLLECVRSRASSACSRVSSGFEVLRHALHTWLLVPDRQSEHPAV